MLNLYIFTRHLNYVFESTASLKLPLFYENEKSLNKT